MFSILVITNRMAKARCENIAGLPTGESHQVTVCGLKLSKVPATLCTRESGPTGRKSSGNTESENGWGQRSQPWLLLNVVKPEEVEILRAGPRQQHY